MNAFEETLPPSLGEVIVVKVRDLTNEDIKLTGFTVGEHSIFANYVYTEELLNAREWNFNSSFGDYPMRDVIVDSLPVKTIEFDRRGLRSEESARRKREAVVSEMLQYLHERFDDIERDMIYRVQTRIDRYLNNMHDSIVKRVDDWLGHESSYGSLNSEHIKSLKLQYQEAKAKADAMYEEMIEAMNSTALEEARDALNEFPDFINKIIFEKFNQNKYFKRKSVL